MIASGRPGPRDRSWRGGLTVALAVIVALGVVVSAPRARPRQASVSSAEKGYLFLDHMMDKYATGSRLRLVQSYEGGYLGRQHFTDSFTYDDALIVDALLTRGEPADVRRAEVLGNSLLYVQAHDPAGDGRIRAAYAPTPLNSPAKIDATEASTDVGNMAWVGQSLVQLYVRTRRNSYVKGAVRIADWVQTHTYDTRGSGGYTGGESAGGSKLT